MRTHTAGLDNLLCPRFGALSFVALTAMLASASCNFDASVGADGVCNDGQYAGEDNRRCVDGTRVRIDTEVPRADTGEPGDTADQTDPGDTGGVTDGGDTGDMLDTRSVDGCETSTSWYRDEDGDGYGTSQQTQTACSKPDGYVAESGDCDDGDASINPDAPEQCNGTDDDCDGMVDEENGCPCVFDPSESDNIDTDSDYKNGVCTGQTVDDSGDCEPPVAFTPRTDDEAGAGRCDGIDNDCDGDTDEACGCTYDPNESRDVDADMSHNSGVCTAQSLESDGTCREPSNFEPRTDSEANCDQLDNDCDGSTDEGCSCTYDPGEADNVDSDGTHSDGVCTGQTRDASGTCRGPIDFEMRTGEETDCGGLDNDCDGAVDEGCTCAYDPTQTNAVDTDDSHNSGLCANQTRGPGGVCQEPSDFEVRTDQESNCDESDNDCDGAIDEGCACTYDPDDPNHADSDGDNAAGVCLGQARNADGICETPAKYDGTDDESRVGDGSLCDGSDNDCDGIIDEGCPCLYDPNDPNQIDGDDTHAAGVCTGQTVGSKGTCNQPANFEARTPSETSCSDGLDNDCDGRTDEGWKSPGSTCSKNCECYSGNCVGGSCTHRVFVTSSEYDGDVGGLAGADAICNRTAKRAKLSGTWRAILSDGSNDAEDRITLVHQVDDMGGNQVASQSEFWSSDHDRSIDRDQSNSQINTCDNCFDDHVWTGSETDGTSEGNHCNDWTSNSGGITGGDSGRAGDAGDDDSEWIDNWTSGCDNTRHLYCIDGQ